VAATTASIATAKWHPDPASEQEEILWRLERDAPRYNEWLLSRALPFLGEHVFEVGAGIGTFTLLLAERGIQVTAAEPDQALADILEESTRHLPGVRVLRQEIGDVPHEALRGQVDSVICFNVLEHVRDDAAALRTIHGLLGSTGQLLLLAPAHPILFGETDRAVDHERRYTTAGSKRALTDAGFEIAEVRYVNPLGAAGWLLSSRVLRRRTLPRGPLKLYERLIPGLRLAERMRLPFGLSVWARGICGT